MTVENDGNDDTPNHKTALRRTPEATDYSGLPYTRQDVEKASYYISKHRQNCNCPLCKDGTPDDDWNIAEMQLRGSTSPTEVIENLRKFSKTTHNYDNNE